MIERFRDERRLRDALLQQRLVAGEPVLLSSDLSLVHRGRLVEFIAAVGGEVADALALCVHLPGGEGSEAAGHAKVLLQDAHAVDP